jgi:hypothetical protein
MDNSTVLIVGNGISRLAYTKQILDFKGDVWASNYAFWEFSEKLTRLNGHQVCLLEAQNWKDQYGCNFEIYAGPIAKKRPDWKMFSVGPKWQRDSGTTLICEALHLGFKIEVVGFDLGGPDVYAPEHRYVDKTSWVNRWAEILQEWGLDSIKFWGHDHKEFISKVINNPQIAKEYSRLYRSRKPHLENETFKKTYEEFYMPVQKSEEKKIKVKFPNGYQTEMRESVANIIIGKGQAVKIQDEKNPEVKIQDEKKASK